MSNKQTWSLIAGLLGMILQQKTTFSPYVLDGLALGQQAASAVVNGQNVEQSVVPLAIALAFHDLAGNASPAPAAA